MSNLERRVDVLEQRGKGEKKLLWISQSPNGLEHRGRHYAGAAALLQSMGLKEDEAILVGWTG